MLGLNRFFFSLPPPVCSRFTFIVFDSSAVDTKQNKATGKCVVVCVCCGFVLPHICVVVFGLFCGCCPEPPRRHPPFPLPFPSRVGRLCRGFVVPTFTFLCCPSVFVDTVSVQHSREASKDRTGSEWDRGPCSFVFQADAAVLDEMFTNVWL